MPAPSGYLGYIKEHQSNEMMQEISIPYFTPCTFYSLLNWNGGQNDEMAGYAGFQVLKNGSRTFHFSVWDPDSFPQKPVALEVHSSATSMRFGNEKEGIKIILPIDLESNKWHRVRLHIFHPDEANTCIVCYLGSDTSLKEEKVATVNFPFPNKTFLTGYSCFIEDFCNTPQEVRKYYIRGGKSFDINQHFWHAWNQQRFQYNEADPNKAINAGIENEVFFLESGGDTKLQLPNHSILKIN